MPETLRQYTIIERIGAGRLGDVYRARDTRIGRTVAIKAVPKDIVERDSLRKRLVADAQKAVALSHANIAGLVEYVEQEDALYLVFEYAAGDRLKAAIGGRPMNIRRAVDFGIQLADALAEAHALDIVHGDLKPDNIVVTQKGRPKILDFGFAHWTAGGAARAAAAAQQPVEPEVLIGTVPYMSPEQALGDTVDNRTDIFSLGVILFEMVAGRPPFLAQTAPATLVQILRDQPVAPSSLNPQVPPNLDLCISRALAKSLDVRYSNAAAVATELRQVAAEMDAKVEELRAASSASAAPPRRGQLGLRAGLLMLLLLSVAAWTWRDELRGAFRRWTRPVRAPIIALAPFQLSGPERSRVYFADGFTEDVASRLGQIPGLTIVGRTSVRSNHGIAASVVGKQFGAPLVLAGTIRTDRDQIVVSAQLVDTKTAGEAWSAEFRGDTRNVCALQAEIAEALARDLGIRLAPSAARDRLALRTVDPNAYDLYLQGRDAAARADVPRAVALLEQAVSVDASLAEAQAVLARTLASERDISGEFDPALEARIAQASGAAIAADPDLPDAQSAMGLAESGQDDALAYFRHAVELDPSFALGYHQIGDEVVGIDTERAIAFYQRSLELDPKLDISYRDRANAYALLDQFEDSLRDIGKGQAINPSGWWWRGMMARVQFDQGRYGNGIGIVAGDPALRDSAPLLVAYAAALRMDGRQQEAVAAAAEFRNRHPNSCAPAALVAAFNYDAGREREAVAEASRVVQAAQAPAALVSTYPCAAMASAAINDAAGVGFWLRRIAESDEATRRWVHHTQGSSPDAALRRKWYPWNKVAGEQQVISAVVELEKGRVRLRAGIAAALEGLLTRAKSPDM
jgi:TolB-like protein